MTVEAATFITELDETLPADADVTTELDDHIRLVKTVLQNTLPGDGATDLFSQAVLPTLLQMNSWDSRLTALEGASTVVPSPVIGHIDIPFDAVAPIPVTGIGFQPTQVLVAAISKSSFQYTNLSFASWTATTDQGNTHGFWSSAADKGTKRFSQYIAQNSVSVGSTSDLASITNPNADGFDVFINQSSIGMNLIYMAFP